MNKTTLVALIALVGCGTAAPTPSSDATAIRVPAAGALPAASSVAVLTDAPIVTAPPDASAQAPAAPSDGPPDCMTSAPASDARAIVLRRSSEAPHQVPDDVIARFPAVSEDGRELVVLASSEHDFIGGEVQTLRFFDLPSGRRSSSWVLFDAVLHASAAEVRSQRSREDQAFRQGQALLAKKRWRTLERAVEAHFACSSPEWALLDQSRGATSRLPLRFVNAKLDIELVAPNGATKGKVLVRTLDAKWVHEREVKVTFPKVGRSLSVPRTACGEVTDLQGGYVTADRSLLVLLPQAELGGDSCMEELAVDRLMLVPLGAR
ncbi:MAG: hypothetical protein HY898_11480 [Deltaproteobacteria bacterium]|nr:hypothetical protein [Deltaproteobacteria bacterium]